MGNDASKKKKSMSPPPNPSKDILGDNFSEFEPISHPSTPEEKTVERKTNIFTTDEMSYSGILVEKAGSIIMSDDKTTTNTSAFSSPPPSQASNPSNLNRRRILKATPPGTSMAATASSTAAAAAAASYDKDNEDDKKNIHHGSGKQHLPSVLSPKASSELLKESIEHSKTKRLEQLSREQKSKRDKLLESKRRSVKTGSDSGGSSDEEQGVDKKKKKEPPQPNPFSKFLKVFSVEPAYPHHKRSYEEGDIDREEDDAPMEKTTSSTSTPATSGRHSPSVLIAPHNESKRQKMDEAQTEQPSSLSDQGIAILSSWMESMPEWVPMATASAAMAFVAVIVALKITKNNY